MEISHKSVLELALSIILLKHKSKCHMAPPCSLSRARNFYINQKKAEEKKENLGPLFYIKGFGHLRFNSLKMIWI
jgi:hypothetical protein